MTTKLSDQARKNKSERNTKYNADNTTRLPINLNHRTDADILAFLAQSENKQGLIKELLRLHMTQIGFTQGEDNDE